MKDLNKLVSAILEETKVQEDKRQEYLKLVDGLIGSITREGRGITKRLNFEWYSNRMGGECVSFNNDIIKRNDIELTAFDKECLQESNSKMTRAVNYMVDCGDDTIDDFISYLSNVAFPLFLQDRYPADYEIKRSKSWGGLWDL